jgi:phytanoyl-CoA hydroxylase
VQTTRRLTREHIRSFREEGYLLVEGLFAPEEVKELVDNFMQMHAGGPIPGCFEPADPEEADGDILKLYPRIMHPHRVNELALRYLLDDRLEAALTGLFGEEPLAAQSMLYFKPAGAKGQALRQDNFYLKVEPGTCIAAWVALDPAD